MSAGPGAHSVVGEPIEFDDAEGMRWIVTEHDMRGIEGARGLRCLVFASRYVFRRVWSFPDGWRTLPPVALAELSWAH